MRPRINGKAERSKLRRKGGKEERDQRPGSENSLIIIEQKRRTIPLKATKKNAD